MHTIVLPANGTLHIIPATALFGNYTRQDATDPFYLASTIGLKTEALSANISECLLYDLEIQNRVQAGSLSCIELLNTIYEKFENL